MIWLLLLLLAVVSEGDIVDWILSAIQGDGSVHSGHAEETQPLHQVISVHSQKYTYVFCVDP